MSKSLIQKLFVAAAFVVAPFAMSSNADAALNSCVTRSLLSNYTGATWLSKTVCSAGEIAVSAGGFCSAAGNMKGVSTTTGTTDQLVWLWCSSAGQAYWYAMCCKP